MTREKQLERALKVCYDALCTYGSHPIIGSQVQKALKAKDGAEERHKAALEIIPKDLNAYIVAQIDKALRIASGKEER